MFGGCDKASGPRPDPGIAPADRQEIERLLDEAELRASAFTAARERGLREAYLAVSVSESSPPCPEKVPKPPPLPGEDAMGTPEARALLDTARWRMNVVPAWTLLGEAPRGEVKPIQKIALAAAQRGPRRDQYERQSSMLRRVLTDGKYTDVLGRDDVLALARELGTDAYWGWELDVVAAIQADPTHGATDTFESGLVVGTALLWSFPEGRVVCAASVKATNQDRIELRFDPNDKSERRHQRLDDDLKNEAYRAAIDGLRAVPAGTKAAASSASASASPRATPSAPAASSAPAR